MTPYRSILSRVFLPATLLTLTACGGSSSDPAVESPVAAALHDEAVNGDISSDPNNPLPLQLADGDNQIRGSVVAPDVDYITVNIPAGSQLSGLVLDEYVSLSTRSFIAVQAGSVFTELPATAAVENLLGYAHFGTDMLNIDILEAIATGPGSQGFSGALPAGDYTFWIQETGNDNADFALTFQITAADTPEPAAPAALFDEAVDGEITNDPSNPLPLQLANGDNRIVASVVAPDRDYITMNVPAGHELGTITLESYVSANSRSFIGVQIGTLFTEDASNPAVENLLGYAHFGTDMLGSNIISALSTGAGSQGFTPPLSAGDYTFWIQETGSAEVNFTLNFELTETP